MPNVIDITASLGVPDLRTKDPDLTQYALDWADDESTFIARRACSSLTTMSQDFSYPVFDREAQMSQRADVITPEGVPAEAYVEIGRQSGRVQPIGFEAKINMQAEAQARGTAVDLERHATQDVTAAVLRRMEQDYFDAAFTGSNWWGNVEGDTAATPVATFDPGSTTGLNKILRLGDQNSDPIKTLRQIRTKLLARTGYPPNLMIPGHEVFEALIEHDNVIARLDRGQTTGPAMANADDIARLVGIPMVLPMESVSLPDVFFNKNEIWIGYVDPNPTPNSPTAIACVSWDAFADGDDMSIDTYYDNKRLSNIVRNITAYQIHVVAKDLGLVITNWNT